MERRNFNASTRFTATEEKAVQETMKRLGLDGRGARGKVVRYGTLFFCGLNPNPMSPQVRDHIRRVCWNQLKFEIFGVSKKTWDILAKIFGESKFGESK